MELVACSHPCGGIEGLCTQETLANILLDVLLLLLGKMHCSVLNALLFICLRAVCLVLKKVACIFCLV
jgi:hypothetical protein